MYSTCTHTNANYVVKVETVSQIGAEATGARTFYGAAPACCVTT